MRNDERTVGVGVGLTSGRYICMSGSSRILQRMTARRSGAGLFSTTLRIDSTILVLGKESAVFASYPTELLSPTAGGGRSNSDELTAAASRSVRFIDKDSAEHITTIFGSAWPSSTASFSSSSSMWTMASGRPLAGARKLQRRPSASQISCTKMVSSDARSRKRLDRCGGSGVGSGLGSTVRSTGGEERKRGCEWICHHELPWRRIFDLSTWE